MSRSCTSSCISWSPPSGSVMAWRLPHNTQQLILKFAAACTIDLSMHDMPCMPTHVHSLERKHTRCILVGTCTGHRAADCSWAISCILNQVAARSLCILASLPLRMQVCSCTDAWNKSGRLVPAGGLLGMLNLGLPQREYGAQGAHRAVERPLSRSFPSPDAITALSFFCGMREKLHLHCSKHMSRSKGVHTGCQVVLERVRSVLDCGSPKLHSGPPHMRTRYEHHASKHARTIISWQSSSRMSCCLSKMTATPPAQAHSARWRLMRACMCARTGRLGFTTCACRVYEASGVPHACQWTSTLHKAKDARHAMWSPCLAGR